LSIWCSGLFEKGGSRQGVNPSYGEAPHGTTPGNFEDNDISGCSLTKALERDK